MASGPKPLNIENPKGWAVKPIEGGTHTAIIFDMRDGPFGVALNNDDLSRFIERILQELAKLTATQTPEYPPKGIVAAPVPVTSFGFAPDPHDSSSTVLVVAVGNVRISFQVDATMLQTTCKRIVASARAVKPRTTN
jgi:hypothetical protein